MRFIEFSLHCRGKEISYQSKVRPAEEEYARFLITKNNNYLRLPQFSVFASKIGYEGNQLFLGFLFLISMLIAEISIVFTTHGLQSIPIVTMLSCLYAVIFTFLIPSQKLQSVLQIIFTVLSIIFATITFLGVISINFQVLLVITVTTVSCIFAKIIKALVANQTLEQPVSGFSIESGFLLIHYLSIKMCILLNQQSLGFNYCDLYAPLFVLIAVNAAKVFALFDFDIVLVSHIFQKLTEYNNEYENSLNGNTPLDSKKLKSLLPGFIEDIWIAAEMEINKDLIGIAPNEDIYESVWRQLATICVFLFQVGPVITLLIMRSSLSTQQEANVCWAIFFDIGKISVLLSLLDCTRTIKSIASQSVSSFLRFAVDFCLYILAFLPIMLPNTFSTYINIESTFLTSINFFLALSIYNFLHNYCHEQASNASYASFFILFLTPFSIHQTLRTTFPGVVLYVDYAMMAYCFLVLIGWSGYLFWKNLVKGVKEVWEAEIFKMGLIDKLSTLELNEMDVVQNNVYFQIICLLTLRSLRNSDFAADRTLTWDFTAFYFSAVYMQFKYFANTIILSRREQFSKYEMSGVSILVVLMCLVYLVLAQVKFQSNSSIDNVSTSCIFFILFVIHTVASEIERMLAYSLVNFKKCSRSLMFYIYSGGILYPLLASYGGVHFLVSFDGSALWLYGPLCFGYIWLILTTLGVIIHLVVGLSDKARKELFVMQYMAQQMLKLRIKEDPQIAVGISNRYEIYNNNPDKLLSYLTCERHLIVQMHEGIDILYDYSIVLPTQNRMSLQTLNARKKDFLVPIELIPAMQKKILNTIATASKTRVKPQTNKNVTDLERLLSSSHFYEQRPQQFEEELLYFQRSADFKAIVADRNKCGEAMNKLFTFLSYPYQEIYQDTFLLFSELVSHGVTTAHSMHIYDRFGQGGMKERGFSAYISDYVARKYQLTGTTIEEIAKAFVNGELSRMMLYSSDPFKYWMKSKKHKFTEDARIIWLSPKVKERDFIELHNRKSKQQRIIEASLESHHKQKLKIDNQINRTSALEIELNPIQDDTPKVEKKNKIFLHPKQIYSSIVAMITKCHVSYAKEAANFKITKVKCSLSNILVILTKTMDFTFVYALPTANLYVGYSKGSSTVTTDSLAVFEYPVLIGLASAGVLAYVGLLLFHRVDFQKSTLGLDKYLRTLDYRQFKFYTTTFLFLLGSALANYVILICVNSMTCSNSRLYNFPGIACFNDSYYAYLSVSVVILFIYWPLSVITFPYSLAIDRSLEIKYKSEYEIVYLQCKFLVNGFNTLLAPLGFTAWASFNCVLKAVTCTGLAHAVRKYNPCSYHLVNLIQGKIFFLLALLNLGGVLCYFIDFTIAISIICSFMLLALAYGLCEAFAACWKDKHFNAYNADDMIEMNKKRQEGLKNMLESESESSNDNVQGKSNESNSELRLVKAIKRADQGLD